MNVSDLMTKTVVVITQQDTIRTALRLLEECEVRHLPVLAGQNIVGIVSDRDVRRFRLPSLEEVELPDYADALLDKSVTEAMKTDLLLVSEHDSLRDAIDVMLDCGIGAVPVVASGTKHLLGMLSYVDVLRAVRNGLLHRDIDAA